MVEYAADRLNIDDAIFHSINWTSIGGMRASHRIERVVRTSRIMYQWLPVGHNWYKCNLVTDVCLCYGVTDESFKHLPHVNTTTLKTYDELHISRSKKHVTKRNSHSNPLGSSSVSSDPSLEPPPRQSSMICPPQWRPPSSPRKI